MDFERKYEGPKVTFKFDSGTYVLLTYAKMKGLPISIEQCCSVLSGKFESKSSALRSMMTLLSNECVREVVPGKWVITPKGYAVVYHVGRARKAPLYLGAFG